MPAWQCVLLIIVFLAVAAFTLYRASRGLRDGAIMFHSRFSEYPFTRDEQPVRFWFTVVLCAACGLAMLGLAGVVLIRLLGS
jgi:hypothetical protein